MPLPLKRLWYERADHWRFFRQWLRHPLTTAAITPSGPQLVRSMMAELPVGARRVIELGAGTGVMTRALVARGIAPEDLLVLELNPQLASHLGRMFPRAHVVCADARNLPAEARRRSDWGDEMADAVVSSLGLLSMPATLQREIVMAAFECLRPDGRFIQLTYGPRPPLRAEVANALGLHVTRGSMVVRNIPPATVFVYTRTRSQAIVPRPVR
ncbi:MAG TPA: methyltransferase domain-containing protein [Chiayiivirga sp.]|mgnify:FL=1|nr:methyltransferase domain-containing protein [Chiayiivirga sp.]